MAKEKLVGKAVGKLWGGESVELMIARCTDSRWVAEQKGVTVCECCVLPESVCIVTCEGQAVLFWGQSQLGTKPADLAWFLSWKRHGGLKHCDWEETPLTHNQHTPLQMQTMIRTCLQRQVDVYALNRLKLTTILFLSCWCGVLM